MPERQTASAGAEQNASTLEDFLQRLSETAKRSFLSLRALVVNLGPDVTETVRASEVAYGRTGGNASNGHAAEPGAEREPFVLARLQRNRLFAVFPDGEALDDPLGRLLRRGRERHVRLDESEEIDAHLQEFARKAYSRG